MANSQKQKSIRSGKTINKYDLGEHRADLFGHYERFYYDTGKVPKGFHV